MFSPSFEEEAMFRTPSALSVTKNVAKRVLCVGSCVAMLSVHVLREHFKLQAEAVHVHAIDDMDFDSIGRDFDYQIITLPVDNVFARHLFFFDDLNDESLAKIRFEKSKDICKTLLNKAMKLNIESGLTSLVGNFFVPQQNPQGRLLPRYDYRNPVFFFEKLNEFLSEELKNYKNSYLLDLDSIASTFGKAYIQDDSVWGLSHGGVFDELDYEVYQELAREGHTRVEPIPRIREVMKIAPEIFWLAVCNEAQNAYRTIRQVDQVKVVAVDLDDTLWRGLVGENIEDVNRSLEGMHYGLIETLLFLKSRGIALAIVSKNSEEIVKAHWDESMRFIMRYEDFAIKKINWNPKSENIRQISEELNVGLNSIVFIDDNPRERHEVSIALPDVRILGNDFYALRRVLLWASETQVGIITDESSKKTEMLQKQLVREELKKTMDRGEFLNSLELEIKYRVVRDESDSSFGRIVELINKTNQFNTTGIRWTREDISNLFSAGGMAFSFSAKDKLTNYGTIAAALVHGDEIKIFVMSCRVIGLEAEFACIHVLKMIAEKAGTNTLRSRFIRTDRNHLAETLFQKTGFIQTDDVWINSNLSESIAPSHIVIRVD